MVCAETDRGDMAVAADSEEEDTEEGSWNMEGDSGRGWTDGCCGRLVVMCVVPPVWGTVRGEGGWSEGTGEEEKEEDDKGIHREEKDSHGVEG